MEFDQPKMGHTMIYRGGFAFVIDSFCFFFFFVQKSKVCKLFAVLYGCILNRSTDLHIRAHIIICGSGTLDCMLLCGST